MTEVIDFWFLIWKKIISSGVQYWIIGIFILLGIFNLVITLINSSQSQK